MTRSFIVLSTSWCLAVVPTRAEEPLPASSQPAPTTESMPATSQPAPPPAPVINPLRQMQDACEDLIARIGPAVVAIQIDRRPSPGEASSGNPLDWVTSGSGVVIRGDGMILTSQHVIEDALAIRVTLFDGRSCRARRVAADPRADLAVLQITERDLAIAELSDVSGVRRGHLVLAFGNPLGLAGDGQAAVSLGIVSAIGRPLPQTVGRDEDRYYGDMIQTSAPIHPGHSGGPLVDIEGRVIGVLTALGAGGGSGAMGFAVPISERTRRIIDRLLEGQAIEYGYLGVEVVNLTEAQIRSAALPVGRGVLVDSVVTGEPASEAGLRGGDIVLSMDQRPVSSADDFVSIVGALEPGQTAEVAYLRKGQHALARVSVGRRPASLAIADSSVTVEFRGAVLESVPVAMREANHLPSGAFLVVLVSAGSPADRAGLAPGDIVVRVNGRSPSAALIRALAASADDCLVGMASGHSVLIRPE